MDEKQTVTTLNEAVVIVREALAHLKALEKISCSRRYYFSKEARQALKIIEERLKHENLT